jgi:hypothetical protein
MEEKQYKEYLALAKQYQKQIDKSHQKQYQQHHEPSMGNEIRKKIVEIPLIAEEIDTLFWGKLVQLGWRTDNTPLLEGVDSKSRTTRFVYVCPECDIPLHAQNVLTVTPSVAKKMCDVSLLQEKLVRHQTIAKDCKAIPEEEAE